MADRRPSPDHTRITRHRTRLVGLARHLGLSADAAEDAAHACLLAALRQIAAGRDIADPGAYLRTALRRRCIRHHQKAALQVDLEDLPEPSVPDAHWHMALRDVQAALRDLPEEQARVLRHVARGETSPKRLAAALGVPQGTVMSRLARGRAQLRAALGRQTGDPFL